MPGADRLAEYRRKREFARTPEPAGEPGEATVAPAPAPAAPAPAPAAPGLSRFVVQKHSASRLHYDLRLEIGGTLASWAVPRGPSRDPTQRRLAVQVEDHPVEYFDFEGSIPAGEYGGGTVMVWDWGAVRWLGDPAEMFARGDIKFELYGLKLAGAYALVRAGGRKAESKDWLLIKKRDEGAAADADEGEADPSALSGRTMSEIAAAGERTWHSGETAAGQGVRIPAFVDLGAATRERFPSTVEPMTARSVAQPIDDAAWSYEVKLDGYRILAHVKDGRVRLLSRRGQDYSARFPELDSLALLLRGRDAVLDGELVALDDAGAPSFGLLQERAGGRRGPAVAGIPVVYYVFDVVHLDGLSLAAVPLAERRRLLAAILLRGPSVRVLDAFPGTDGSLLFAAVRAQGQEGVVAKRLASPYRRGQRSADWLKIKVNPEQSCVVVGFTPPQGGRKNLGGLSLAVLEEGKLAYAGQVGSGFTDALLAEVHTALAPMAVDEPPDIARRHLVPRVVTWVKPELVCDVKFNEWTRDGVLRQPTLVRLRPDLSVADCGRDGDGV